MNAADHLSGVPLDRVVALPGVDAGALALLIADDHPDLAAVVSRPPAAPAAPRDVVQAAVDELERVAVEPGRRAAGQRRCSPAPTRGGEGPPRRRPHRTAATTERAATEQAVAGSSHPASSVERALEAALAAESWAAGRMWNQTYQSHALTSPVRLDLLWPAERCVVELDGPEHCRPRQFEQDRQRDVQLQLDGYAVLRFTNARVGHDVGAVVHQIGTYLQGGRRKAAEGTSHGRR